jgi:hypothetical protein
VTRKQKHNNDEAVVSAETSVDADSLVEARHTVTRGVLLRGAGAGLFTLAAGAAAGSRLQKDVDSRKYADDLSSRLPNVRLEARVEGYRIGIEEEAARGADALVSAGWKDQLAADESLAMSVSLARGLTWSGLILRGSLGLRGGEFLDRPFVFATATNDAFEHSSNPLDQVGDSRFGYPQQMGGMTFVRPLLHPETRKNIELDDPADLQPFDPAEFFAVYEELTLGSKGGPVQVIYARMLDGSVIRPAVFRGGK